MPVFAVSCRFSETTKIRKIDKKTRALEAYPLAPVDDSALMNEILARRAVPCQERLARKRLDGKTLVLLAKFIDLAVKII